MDKALIELRLPDGQQLVIGDGRGPRAQIRIRDTAFYKRCFLYGEVGFGEAYADGLWDTNDLSGVIRWLLLNADKTPTLSSNTTQALMLNRRNISDHYDLSNDFFSIFLDETMT